MAVAIVDTGQSGTATASTTPKIASFVASALTNGIILLAVSQYRSTDLAPSATWNGSSFTPHDANTITESPGTRRVSLLYLKTSGGATADILVSYAGGSVDECVMGALTFSGVDQTTPLGTATKSSGTSATTSTATSVTPSATGYAFAAIANDAGSVAADTSNQTKRYGAINAASNSEGCGATAAGTGSAISFTFTNASNLNTYVQIAVPITAATGGGGGGSLLRIPQLDGIGGAGKFARQITYHQTPAISKHCSLEAYHREREREHRAFLAKVRRAA